MTLAPECSCYEAVKRYLSFGRQCSVVMWFIILPVEFTEWTCSKVWLHSMLLYIQTDKLKECLRRRHGSSGRCYVNCVTVMKYEGHTVQAKAIAMALLSFFPQMRFHRRAGEHSSPRTGLCSATSNMPANFTSRHGVISQMTSILIPPFWRG